MNESKLLMLVMAMMWFVYAITLYCLNINKKEQPIMFYCALICSNIWVSVATMQ